MKTIKIFSHCSDMFNAELFENGKKIHEYGGYVPEIFERKRGKYGDDVVLEIELKTGKIIGWKEPTQKELDEIFKQDTDEE